MRIVSGIYKGKIFTPPKKKFSARPTTDIAKEGLFNIINNYFNFEDISVLDLFAGTGSISFEFASRGCTNIHLVENNPQHLFFIRKVISELNLKNIVSIRQNAFTFLEKCYSNYNIIFADPPYDTKGIEKIPELVFKNSLLKQSGWLILEHSKKINLSKYPYFESVRNYGNVHFSFFINKE
jgi:16S rRNA (guanine(966)-N(2))-methyltransferase RsmD